MHWSPKMVSSKSAISPARLQDFLPLTQDQHIPAGFLQASSAHVLSLHNLPWSSLWCSTSILVLDSLGF